MFTCLIIARLLVSVHHTIDLLANQLKKFGVKNVEAGVGCGVGFGHGFGIGKSFLLTFVSQEYILYIIFLCSCFDVHILPCVPKSVFF